MSSYFHTDGLLEAHGLMLEQDSCRGTHLFLAGPRWDDKSCGTNATPEQVIAYMEDLERRFDLPDRDWILQALRTELAIEGSRLLRELEQSPEERQAAQRQKDLTSKIVALTPEEFDAYLARGGHFPPSPEDDMRLEGGVHNG